MNINYAPAKLSLEPKFNFSAPNIYTGKEPLPDSIKVSRLDTSGSVPGGQFSVSVTYYGHPINKFSFKVNVIPDTIFVKTYIGMSEAEVDEEKAKSFKNGAITGSVLTFFGLSILIYVVWRFINFRRKK